MKAVLRQWRFWEGLGEQWEDAGVFGNQFVIILSFRYAVLFEFACV